MTLPPQPESTRRLSLAESPWFWLYLFSTAALAGILLIGPKYFRREATLEQKAQARQEIALRQAGAERVAPLPAGRLPDERPALGVPLRWLAGAVGAAMVASLAGLIVSRRRQRRLPRGAA